MKLKQLEGLLGNLQQFANPKIELEQYPTGAHIASRMLFTAENSFGDVSNKIVADFGCGCGTLGLAATLLDAEHVIGLDIDDESIEIASINADELEVEMELIQCEIKNLAWRGQMVDTVVMNPPFGTRKKGADMEFLSVALKVASEAVYSLHKTSTREHIKRAALRDYNASSAEVLCELRYDLPKLYKFHKKKDVDISVDLWRFVPKTKQEPPPKHSIPSRASSPRNEKTNHNSIYRKTSFHNFTYLDNDFPVVSIANSLNAFEKSMMLRMMKLSTGLPAARRSIVARFVSSSSAKSDATRFARVSGGLAAETLVIDEEAAPATAVKSTMLPTLLQPRVVVYDGVCHLCHRGVKFVINADKDRRIKFCCLQSKAAEPYLRVSGLDREDVLRRFLFIEGPYEYHQGSTAALKVLSYLPLPYSVLSAFTIIPTPIRDLAYDYIAKKRYDWFGKDTNCLVLKEKELLERFIDRDEMLQKEWSDE
ncbi:hypothetical protein SSX86_027586 [Deinandra increscens subsp. villosa]|uniref:Methyltransferase small domain-containing protein n=1 Tax=Deinandra increscens subsp. villosa TaxID=3103831 RepID=A0AAP0C7R5_9ASTR